MISLRTNLIDRVFITNSLKGSLVAYIYPSLAFMSAIIDETGKRKMLNFTSSTYLIVLGSNGLLYLLLLILYEFHFHTSLMQFMNSKKFSESFDVPYGNDVIEERARVTRPSGFGTILVVKGDAFRRNRLLQSLKEGGCDRYNVNEGAIRDPLQI
ncbi:hypothetical protein Y032_0104g3635 [Ancylostoma ceylanicum]|uniref:Uncharacterized protein n=1 Tax=Ancylostoma ceylanicum TaxID=53326 RepID=A0A016TFT4_9BILA|nr:hypothetical protein Y032_0104g3635 [Ancylostoma ceylanicum]